MVRSLLCGLPQGYRSRLQEIKRHRRRVPRGGEGGDAGPLSA